jgi:hypothetical protein
MRSRKGGNTNDNARTKGHTNNRSTWGNDPPDQHGIVQGDRGERCRPTRQAGRPGRATRARSRGGERSCCPEESAGKKHQQRQQASRRATTTIAHAVDDYLLDHEGGNHSAKTLEWHRTALGLMRTYFEQERGTTLVGEVDASTIKPGSPICARALAATANRALNAPSRPTPARPGPSSTG